MSKLHINLVSKTYTNHILFDRIPSNIGKLNIVKNVPVWKILGNDNRLIMIINKPYTFRTEKYYTSEKSELLHDFSIIKNSNATAFEKLRAYRNVKAQFNARIKSPSYGNIDDIEKIYIDTKKLIFKSQTEIYYVHGKSVRRVKANSKLLNSLLRNFLMYIIDNNLKEDFAPVLNLIFKCFYKNYNNVLNIATITGNTLIDNRYVYNFLDLADRLGDITIPKFIRKLMNANSSKLGIIRTFVDLHRAGVKDTNAIKTIINALILHDGDQEMRCVSIDKYSLNYYKALKKFYKNTNVNPDMVFANRIMYNKKDTNLYYTIADCIHMHYNVMLNRRFYKDKDLIALDKDMYKMSIVNLHNYLAKVIRNDHAKINYREYDNSVNSYLEKEIEGYKFILPRTSLEVARMADIFQNCVAGYATRISEDEIIMYATNRKDIIDYIQNDIGDYHKIRESLTEIDMPLCIEIRKNRYGNGFLHTERESLEVIQNYTLNNKLPYGKLQYISNLYFDSVEVKHDCRLYDNLPF